LTGSAKRCRFQLVSMPRICTKMKLARRGESETNFSFSNLFFSASVSVRKEEVHE
jgi:hypothetical protein